jgi:hypothetical protein
VLKAAAVAPVPIATDTLPDAVAPPAAKLLDPVAALKAPIAVHDFEQYVELAIAKASDITGLAELRAGLRERMERTQFGDPLRYAKAVEGANREMWEHWCATRDS